MSSNLKPVVLSICALGAGLTAVGLVYVNHERETSNAAEYTVASVERGDIIQAVTAIGRLGPLVTVDVSSQISGLITEVNVDFNSVVKKGDVLVRIDPSTYEQRLHQAQADLAAARATHALTLLNARRLRDLKNQDLITQQEFDEAEAQVRQTEAVLLTRGAVVENAKVDLARCTLRSPIDGIVIFKQIEVGKTVVSSLSAPTLVTIAQDLSKMRVIASISELDVGLIQPGQAVTFTVDPIRDRIFTGRVMQVRNPYTPSETQMAQSDQSALASFDVVIEVDNADLVLRPSVTANVSIVIARRSGILLVPNGALRLALREGAVRRKPRDASLDDGVGMVYRLRDRNRGTEPEQIRVRTGLSDDAATEILSGLNESDLVITSTMSIYNASQPRKLFF